MCWTITLSCGLCLFFRKNKNFHTFRVFCFIIFRASESFWPIGLMFYNSKWDDNLRLLPLSLLKHWSQFVCSELIRWWFFLWSVVNVAPLTPKFTFFIIYLFMFELNSNFMMFCVLWWLANAMSSVGFIVCRFLERK